MSAKLVSDNTQHYPHDDDFQEGYEAGYNARADRRVALGTPAYRQGHAYGVQQRMGERRAKLGMSPVEAARAERRFQWHNFLRWLVVGTLIGLLLGWGLVKTASADTLDDWRMLNEVCQGGSGAASDKACTQRSRSAAQLRREGWFEGAHGVWVSPEHVVTFVRITRSYDAIARENTGMLDKVMEGMMTELRRALPPEAIFALWNARAGQILASTPYAASGLMYGLPYLERMLSGRNDPRFVMALRP
jgi:hypothetical protein